ncbi:hypothetical protein ACP4OV_024013 [Aristida adscensionis]
MLLMDSARPAGCSPVCLDLSVGLPSPWPASGSPAGAEPCRPAGGSATPPLNDEEAAKTLEARFTQVSEENRRLTKVIARLYASQTARPVSPATPPAPAARKRSRRESPDDRSSPCGAHGGAGAGADHGGESPLSDGASCRRIKVRRVCTRIDPSDATLVVKDGYQWRKYGQKVTRDNPSPRAYFRCAFAPSCPVKKKVQRSAEDSSVLVATYEGEHNHPRPSRAGELQGCTATTTSGGVPCSIAINSSGPTITLDLTKNGEAGGVRVLEADEPGLLKKLCREIASPEFRAALVEQMASSLTSDPNFTGALAAAILQQLPEY